jgi:hypothetical protein
MNKELTIQSLRWDLQTRDIETARIWQDLLSGFSRNGLSEILEETFKPYQDPHAALCIERMEIELPLFSDAGELRYHIKRAVENYLKVNEQAIKAKNKTEFTVLKMLGRYLEDGYLPWYADRELMNKPHLLMVRLLEIPAGQLRGMLKVLAEQEGAIIRLIYLFASDQLSLLTESLAVPGLPVQFLQQIRTLITEIKSIKVSAEKIKWLLYKVLLQKLSGYDHFDITAFAKSWLLDSKSYNIIQSGDLPALSAAFQKQFNILLPDVDDHGFPVASHDGPGSKTSGVFVPDEKPGIVNVKSPDQFLEAAPEKIFLFLENAGAVLLYPYLRLFFLECGLIDDKRKFINSQARMKGVCLLQYLITGEMDFQEHETVLAKILCGYSIRLPLMGADESFYRKNEAAAGELLQSLISHWKKLKNTSISGFRQSFLIRNGKLMEDEDKWVLHIERKSWDVLLESLPFGIHFIKLPWMNKPLYIQW